MKKTICIALAFMILFFSAFLTATISVPTNETVAVECSTDGSPTARTGEFFYINDFKDTYYYDDSYFLGDPTQYNPSLATMSFCLALSAFSAEEGAGDLDYLNNYKNVKYLLCDELGYEAFRANSLFSKEPTANSIAVAVAKKKLADRSGAPFTLIAVAVRGGGYKREWISNFTLGETGQAEGFSSAKEQVLDFLKEYISDPENKISGKIKLWITGFSRGAATSNLVAGEIDDNPKILGSHISLSRNDIFAYCFATPMGAIKDDIASSDASKYNNIWNILNKNDPVPYVAMNGLGFARFGHDRYAPDVLTCPENYDTLQAQMEAFYRKLPGFSETSEYSIDEFSMKRINMLYLALAALNANDSESYSEKVIENDYKNNWSQGKFLDYAISTLTKENVKTRDNYVQNFQSGIQTIFDTLYGSTFSQYTTQTVSKCFDIFFDKLKSPINLARILYGMFESDISSTKIIAALLAESMNECGMNVTPAQVEELEAFAKSAIALIARFSIAHPNLTATFFSNMEHIGSGHNHQLYFAWLKVEDPNYSSAP